MYCVKKKPNIRNITSAVLVNIITKVYLANDERNYSLHWTDFC